MSFPTNKGSTEELKAVNQVLAAIGQAPVTTLTGTTNPDVAIVSNTLDQVSREVQSEGWTFNKEFNVKLVPDSNKHIVWPDAMIQLDISSDPSYASKINYDTVKRDGKLYNRLTHTFKFDDDVLCDITYLYGWEDLPIPARDYIVARASTKTSMRLIGDNSLYQQLSEQEIICRSYLLEYECNQGDYSMFGSPRSGSNYVAYQPYQALRRI